MHNGLMNFSWNKIDKYSEEEITYFLFLEGKNIKSICKIRGLDELTVKQHILQGKIRYGILVKSKDGKQLFKIISKSGKQDKIDTLLNLDNYVKNKLVRFIKDNYGDMLSKDKEVAVWIIGELKEESCKNILIKASVHKHVNVRRMAISAMGKFQDNYFERALIRALNDENPQVVFYAIKALGKMKSNKALVNIRKIYDNTNKQHIQRACKVALENICTKGDEEIK